MNTRNRPDIEITRYDTSNPVDHRVAKEIRRLIDENMSPYYPEDEHAAVVSKHDDEIAINEMISSWRHIIVARDVSQKICGLLEADICAVQGGTYFHVSWLITDSTKRWQGIASLLHDEFEKGAQQRKGEVSGETCQSLMVDKENTYAKSIYEKWGYVTKPEASQNPSNDSTLEFMVKAF